MDIQAIRKALNNTHSVTRWNKYKKDDYSFSATGLQLIEESNKVTDMEDKIVPNFSVDGYDFYLEEQFGGEGQGDDYWIVFYVTRGDEKKYYKIPGWYASYNGRDLDVGDTYEVEPKEVTVVQWHKKV